MTIAQRLTTLVVGATLCAAMPTTTASAQQMQASLSHYTTDDGLASNAIAYMNQDDYGYIWIATWNGLSRFDGYDFYNYRTGNGSHIKNLHNRIMDFVIDNAQNIWLRMYDGRVFCLNRLTDTIENPFEGISGSDEYRTERPLFTTSTGEVLASISGIGLYRMRLDRGHFTTQLITTAGLTVNCVAEGYHNDVWVGTNRGLRRLNTSNLSLERKALLEDEAVTALHSNGYNIYVGTSTGRVAIFAYGQEPRTLRQPTGMGIWSMMVDSHGLVWFADDRPGASRLNPATGDEKLFQQRVPVPEHDGYGGKFNESGGTVWVRMNHGGYGYYNRQTDQVEYFHNDPSNPWNLSNTVNASTELAEGVVFMSTSRRALEKLEILRSVITRTQLVPGAESTVDNEVRGMLYDARHKLLIMGNKNSSLFLIRADSTRTVVTTDSEGHPLGRTYGIAQDRQGNVWLCSKDYGLFKMAFTAGGQRIERFSHRDNDKWSLSSNSAYAAVEDADGNLWVATYGGGVNVMTRQGGRTVFLNPQNAMKSYPHNSYLKVRTVALDKDGNVWAGTTDGILIMSLKGGEVSVSRLLASEKEPDRILMSNDIVVLACDKAGNMWVGTNGGGLSRTTGKDSQGRWLFETYDSKSGLPSEEIRSITFDNRGNAWVATDHILCSFDTEKHIFTTFSNLDGVDETMCSEGAAIALPSGDILFGTLDGYYTVDRKKLASDHGSTLKLHITEFYLDEQLQSPRLGGAFSYNVPEAKTVTLPSHDSQFAFRFAALNYQLQHRVHYQYMLEGYDRDWQSAGPDRTASYKGVPAGTYRFKVKAFLLESPDKYDLKTIEVVVPPHFLLSSTALWIYLGLAALLAVVLLFRYQERLKRRLGVAPEAQPSLAQLWSRLKALLPSRRSAGSKTTQEHTDEYEIIDD